MAVLSARVHPEVWVEPPAVLGGQVYARAMDRLDSGVRALGAARRANEFAAGRQCAARALVDAGARDLAVGVSPDRSPRWPAGFVGSISHTSSFVWAAVARDSELRSLGIDSEPIFDDQAIREAAPVVLDGDEWRLATPGSEAIHATLVFSAKESLYKCLNPCTGVFFEFDAVRFEGMDGDVKSGRGTFVLRLRTDVGDVFVKGTRFAGRYSVEHGHIHTAVELLRGA